MTKVLQFSIHNILDDQDMTFMELENGFVTSINHCPICGKKVEKKI